MDWKLADAKNRLSELVTLATVEGPQTIRRHDAAVVVVAETTYRLLTGEQPSLKDLLLNGPSLEGVIPERDRSPMRTVEL
jgi:antitoxin Phd